MQETHEVFQMNAPAAKSVLPLASADFGVSSSMMGVIDRALAVCGGPQKAGAGPR